MIDVGKVLKGDLEWSEDTSDRIREAFQIANNWRDAHYYPMTKMRRLLIARMQSHGVKGLTAARLKRMGSIRKKLRTINANLRQIQDLGGCRAILPSMQDVRTLIEAVHVEFGTHAISKESDYISRPKTGGYRSHHLVLRYGAEHTSDPFDGRFIEVQIRSRLQHSWATAVEAVGLFRGEDLKGGQGDARWLKLFELIASELAVTERCPELPGALNQSQRIAQIRSLDSELKASRTLEDLRQIVNYTETYYSPDRGDHYLITYDTQSNTVSLRDFYSALQAAAAYDIAETEARKNGGKTTVVLVEVSKLVDLMNAYPNYYGDVSVFNENLLRIVSGREPREYTLPPQERVPPRLSSVPDTSWFRRAHKPKVPTSRD